MKRLAPAILSGLLLSCQGPAAVLAQEAQAAGGVPDDQRRSLLRPETHKRHQDLSGNCAAFAAHHDPC